MHCNDLDCVRNRFWSVADADQVTSITKPDLGTGAQVTTQSYDSMGRVSKTTLPDNTSAPSAAKMKITSHMGRVTGGG